MLMKFRVESDSGDGPKSFPSRWRPVEGPVMDDLTGVRCLWRGRTVVVVNGMDGVPGEIRCWISIANNNGDVLSTCWADLSDLLPLG